MNLYNKYILPKLLNFAMKSKDMESERPDVADKASGIVLEIGFGSGLNLPYYRNVTKMYALDPSEELYKLAEGRIERVSFPLQHLKASAENIPLQDNSIDSVVSTWSLCSIPHPEVALKEIYRVLKPDGKFIFIEHGKSPKKFVAKVQKFLTHISKKLAGGCHMDREIDTLITGVGFKFENLEKFQPKSKPLTLMYKGIAITRK